MKRFLLATTIATLSCGSAFAAPVCGVPSKISLTANSGGAESCTSPGSLKFTVGTTPFTLQPACAYDSNGYDEYTDPSIMAGYVALLTTAAVSKSSVCFDKDTFTLSLQ